jgi:hypothetical protein
VPSKFPPLCFRMSEDVPFVDPVSPAFLGTTVLWIMWGTRWFSQSFSSCSLRLIGSTECHSHCESEDDASEKAEEQNLACRKQFAIHE